MHVLANSINDWLHSVWFKPGNSDLTIDPQTGGMVFAGVDWMFMFILWVCIISFIMLMGPMCLWAVQYRRRPGIPAQRTPNHNTALEVTWIVVPLIVVTLMFFWGFQGFVNAQVARAGAEEINVQGFKWGWRATYPNGAEPTETVYFDHVTDGDKTRRGSLAFPIIVVPAGKPVKFKLTSTDVIHSFFIPDMRVKIDVFPNRYTSFTFTPLDATGPDGVVNVEDRDKGISYSVKQNLDAAGKPKGGKGARDHYIYCAEYCGQNHSEMAAILRVVDAADYTRVIADWGNIEERVSLVALGTLIYTKNCAQCHTIDGGKNTGPSWKNAYGNPVQFEGDVGGGKIDLANDDGWSTYIRESIEYPAAKIHVGYKGGNMPSFKGQISERAILGVVAYMKSLSDKGKDKLTPAETQTPEPKKSKEGEAPAGAAPASTPSTPATPASPATPATPATPASPAAPAGKPV
ncbi:MAG: c-type cytochrome [Phycisphaerales bacterium]